ncbi:hypothetical protein FD13_GL001440 [Levilactobacillus senmaizukei DSM 21775 = NBRC 103853]|uniref:Restriction endonuclease n=1 Tax=Levilactobacillus senmaizukei DSM 21775 = NBRC 103853 TaxID=1423803 RepID=A0A0R2DN01_9LACO|nr:hypothetical protein [Levilactobacillus senmaizukei]KRN01076.1 hypothetical protein FD13_GL001440 [Levilactobacillus senmaizukei DSM 21775 = NBRC 103853]
MTKKLKELQDTVLKHDFNNLAQILDFSSTFMEYLSDNKQAVIVAQNEHNYNFFQFNKNANFTITRPFNSELILNFNEFQKKRVIFDNYISLLNEHKEKAKEFITKPKIIDELLYTAQQAIGFTLDTLPQGKSNNARKINGDLFELMMLYVMRSMGIDATHGTFPMTIKDDNGNQISKMNWQHDMIVHHKNYKTPSMIGSVKTTSKDRISKVFMDKYLYDRLSGTQTAQIAIFLHDVQRAKAKKEGVYKVSQTFLTGHFKAYTLKINPLDGVYYMDMRPIFESDDLLKKQIKRFHYLLLNDIWQYIS